ncbi:MAG: hypothetical protein Q9227_003683 [Pyrenula ochraceoflavens]
MSMTTVPQYSWRSLGVPASNDEFDEFRIIWATHNHHYIVALTSKNFMERSAALQQPQVIHFIDLGMLGNRFLGQDVLHLLFTSYMQAMKTQVPEQADYFDFLITEFWKEYMNKISSA